MFLKMMYLVNTQYLNRMISNLKELHLGNKLILPKGFF